MYVQERNFVKTARAQMDILETIWSLDATAGVQGKANEQTIGALGHIKTSAHSVQARGVVRAALLCEDILMRLGANGAQKLRTALVSLQTLIAQYSEGLFEIDPEFLDVLEGNAPSKVAIDTPNVAITSAQEKAAAVLSPLLKFVRKSDSLSALKSLMGQGDGEQHAFEPGTARFDVLMRPVTNLCLSEARLVGKTVSVSYASDFETLGRDIASDIQQFLEHFCLHITAQSIGDSGGQISVTAQKVEKVYNIGITWNGAQLAGDFGDHSRLANLTAKLKRDGGAMQVHKAALSDADILVQSVNISFPEISHSAHISSAPKSQIHFLNTAREGLA